MHDLAASQREEILQLGKAHLESLELQRKAYVKARAHAMAQRSSLYARDELEMSVMRIRVRHPHEAVAVHEEAFKLHPAEVPVRNKVCSPCVPYCMPWTRSWTRSKDRLHLTKQSSSILSGA